ncbi:MAG TPA: hypothetical protein VF608_13995 [Thermoanaerobaculia bacterium]
MDTNRGIAEVEAATLHVPVGESRPLPERSGMRGKLETLKSQSLSKVEQVKSNVTRSVAVMKSNVRDQTSARMSDLEASMRSSPMKWAGIAAGTGFGLGLIGRFVHWRNKSQRMMPSLVVIERSC